jgi:hypothetical protein
MLNDKNDISPWGKGYGGQILQNICLWLSFLEATYANLTYRARLEYFLSYRYYCTLPLRIHRCKYLHDVAYSQ